MAIMIPAWIDGALQPVEKLAAHQQGLRHKAVSVFVLADQHLLIQQRALGKYHTPGLWANTCCTHPAWDETSADCATRRLKEELGIIDLSLEHRGRVEYRADVGNDLIEHEQVEIYLANTGRDLSVTANPDEVCATRWITLAALRQEIENTPEKFTPWMRIYLAEHAELIFDQ